MIRLFIALILPEEIVEELSEYRKKNFPEYNFLNWIKNDNLHVTLKFLGNVQNQFVDKISSDLSFLNEYGKLNCQINGLDISYKFNEPKILWANLSMEDSIFDIVKRINSVLAGYQIPVENKKFLPHITLLRIKKYPGAKFLNKIRTVKFKPIKFTANKISLIQSILKPDGAVYKEISNYNLI